MNKYILLISFALLVAGLSHAAEDPMKSLFTFQQTMANKGSTTAMMKLGEMYEQGLGTKQDFGKAIEMYRKAKARGYVGADAAIARVIRTRQTLADTSRRRKQQTAEERRRIQERQRAEAEREARAKARQQALARKRAEQARREGKERTHGYLSGCGCTMNKLAVRTDGVIVPCNQLSHIELGRINQDDLQEVWQNHPELKRLRERRKIPLSDFEFCQDCDYIDYCTGNCPALAYTILSNDTHPSPDACLKRFLEAGGKLPDESLLSAA